MDSIMASAIIKMQEKYEAGEIEHGGGLSKALDKGMTLEELIIHKQEEMIDGVFYAEAMLELLKFKNISRVEVVDTTGRAYTNLNVDSLKVLVQDGGRTLKLFVDETND